MSVSAFAASFPVAGGVPLIPLLTGAPAISLSPTASGVFELVAPQPFSARQTFVPEQLRVAVGHIGAARSHCTERNWRQAHRAYHSAIIALEQPLACQEATNLLYNCVVHGVDLYIEAALGSAAFAPPEKTPETLTRLHRVERLLVHLTSNGDGSDPRAVDLSRIRLIRAHTIMRYATTFPQARMELYERAERLINAANTLELPLALSADLLRLELVARKLERAHTGRDFRTRRSLLYQLRTHLDNIDLRYPDISNDHAVPIAECRADVASLLARMGLWGLALKEARSLSSDDRYLHTDAVLHLLSSEPFLPFVDRQHIMSPQEIAARTREDKRFWHRIRAAIAHAHSESLAEGAGASAVGMVAALAAQYAMTGENSLIAGLFGGVVGTAAMRLANGWRSEEAFDAASLGIFHRSMEESARDCGRLVAQGALDALVLAAPAALITTGTDGGRLVGQTLASAGHMYAQFGSWLVGGLPKLIDVDTYAHLARNVRAGVDRDAMELAGHIAYEAYTKASGILYAAYLFAPGARPFLRRVALPFVPGSVMLGADLGMMIAGTNDYVSRIERGSIAVAEGLAMLMTTGVIALAHRESLRKVAASFGRAFMKTDHNNLVAIALTVGISSALGGNMQRSATPQGIGEVILQGGAITVGLLPIVLGVSGILKRNINIGQGLAEGWSDSRGQALARRVAETLSGGVLSFHAPYVHNRVVRSGTLDIPMAAVRTAIGWDTNLGYATFAAGNAVATNPTASMMWPEVGGTDWQVQALMAAVKDRDADEIADHVAKSTTRMPFLHSFAPHRLADRLYPLLGIRRVVRPPQFPLVPEVHTLATLHQVLDGRHHLQLNDGQVDTLLANVAAMAGKPENFDVARPMLQTIALARESRVHGERIQGFFRTHPWLEDMLDIDRETLQPPRDRRRSVNRARVRRQLAVSSERYTARVRGHAAQGNPSLTNGLFEARNAR